jgi:hypothetical protein
VRKVKAVSAAALVGLVVAGCGGTSPAREAGPASRALPAIVVGRPTPCLRARRPPRATRSRALFPSTALVRSHEHAGPAVARTFTTATCGTGCRGTFSLSAPYAVDEEQTGTVVVQDDDAAGAGRPPHEVRIPVVLVPRA